MSMSSFIRREAARWCVNSQNCWSQHRVRANPFHSRFVFLSRVWFRECSRRCKRAATNWIDQLLLQVPWCVCVDVGLHCNLNRASFVLDWQQIFASDGSEQLTQHIRISFTFPRIKLHHQTIKLIKFAASSCLARSNTRLYCEKEKTRRVSLLT